MFVVLNGINGHYFIDILERAADKTEYVEAAVAYATEDRLFEWCWDRRIPLRFWGRFDETVPVSLPILKNFLARKSGSFSCKLLRHFHAKVIWWHGFGAYVGSANLTASAWFNNIEAGCFFDEDEMFALGVDVQLREMFEKVDKESSPLTEELFNRIADRARELQRLASQDKGKQEFEEDAGVHQWPGLVRLSRKKASEVQKNAFLDEWNGTLQILRDIGDRISQDENRPSWITAEIPAGAQADQFLHAHYEQRVIGDGGRSRSEEFFEQNRNNPEKALVDAMNWWRSLAAPPSQENVMLFEWAPYLREVLSAGRLSFLSEADFGSLCSKVWSIQDHARRVSNATLNLPTDAGQYKMAVKTAALSSYLFSRRSGNGSSVTTVINHVLYGGPEEQVAERLWDATIPGPWKIDHLGISALGELVGWAMPNRFPPRNNRTSKSLRSLGYAVTVHG